MWKLIFSTETNIGIDCNREPGIGEFSIELHPTYCACFNVSPERYRWIGSSIEEVPGWEDAAILQRKKDEIAAERYRRETSDLEYEGMLFFMDREDRTTLEQTMDKIRRGVITESIFKCRNGWITLNEDNIDSIELAGIKHVASAFIWEKNELDKLN